MFNGGVIWKFTFNLDVRKGGGGGWMVGGGGGWWEGGAFLFDGSVFKWVCVLAF